MKEHVYTPEEHQTWARLYDRQARSRDTQIHPMFLEGLCSLELESDRVPGLKRVNQTLQKRTGYEGVLVLGHEDPRAFFPMLADRKFPIGNFIRDAGDLGYTPAPDVFHDLYGHLPLLANEAYADFSVKFGKFASKYINEPELLRQYERLYWFTFEFGLIKTPVGVRILGAGLASSVSETEHALSHHPKVTPFEVESIRNLDFKIDEFQKQLFLMDSLEQFYNCLEVFDFRINNNNTLKGKQQ